MPQEINRRNFMQKLTGVAGTFALSSIVNPAFSKPLEKILPRIENLSPAAAAQEEEFWLQIRLAYTPSSTLLDLNNGGVSPQPKVVQEKLEHYNRRSNEAPSYFMWRQLDRRKHIIRTHLAQLGHVDSETIAISRNATEALETVIFGLRLQAGDEVILSRQDYPNVINAWKQRAHRDGVVLRWVDLEMPKEEQAYFIEKYREAITPKTKVLAITHVINWNGQVLPVKEIVAIAKAKGIETIVDGAHSFANLDLSIADLDCDYFGTSLHKWLCAPFGTGMLYVKKEKIKKLYPLFASEDPESELITKFENLGTRSSATEQSIIEAILFHEMIGVQRKYARLRYLKHYWIEKTKDIPGIQYHCPMVEGFDCGIGVFSVDGIEHIEIVQNLFTKYGIHTIKIEQKNISGIRVSPNVFTLTKDLDRFADGLKKIVNSKN